MANTSIVGTSPNDYTEVISLPHLGGPSVCKQRNKATYVIADKHSFLSNLNRE
jgi:hypothetical protein